MSEETFGKELLAALAPMQRDLRLAIPATYQGFLDMHAGAFAPGALDTKTKELMAFAIAITDECDGCIAAHARAAVRAGASREEAAEAVGVALLMAGGPGTIYGPRAYASFCEFAGQGDV